MSITTTTHLNFHGTAASALEFYQSVFGGSLTRATYGDFGMPKEVPGADKLVFGRLDAAAGLRLMAYDIPGGGPAGVTGAAGTTRRENGMTFTDRTFFQSLRGQSLQEISPLWDGLAVGAQIIEQLAASAWSPGFGMLTDRFGVTWVIDVEAPLGG